jgi:hypothetical protein
VVQAGPPPPPPGAPHFAAIQQLEHKLNVQHAEFQQLLTENQRLAATHVALRQELAAAQGEMQKLKQALVSGSGPSWPCTGRVLLSASWRSMDKDLLCMARG